MLSRAPASVSLTALVALLTISISTVPAASASRATSGPAGGAAASRRGQASSLAERQKANKARRQTLKQAKEEIEARWQLEVVGDGTAAHPGWSDAQVEAMLLRPGQQELLAKELAKQDFGRHNGRLLKALTAEKQLLKRAAAAGDEAEGERLASHGARAVESAELNFQTGFARQIPRIVHSRLRKVLRPLAPLGVLAPGLARDTQFKPGTIASNLKHEDGKAYDELDPVDSHLWKRPTGEVSAEALFAGRFGGDEGAPALPARDDVMQLNGFRALQADGTHPSAFARDADGNEWKIKFLNGGDLLMSSEVVMARLLRKPGYNAPMSHLMRHKELDPRIVLSAYRNMARVSLPSRDPLVKVGAKKNRFSLSLWHKLGTGVEKVTLLDGEELTGKAAVQRLAAADRDVEVLRTIKSVTMAAVDVSSEEKPQESYGPWDMNRAPHVDAREVRALATILPTLFGGFDTKLSNLKRAGNVQKGKKGPDGEKAEDEVTEVIDLLGDTGSFLKVSNPNGFRDIAMPRPLETVTRLLRPLTAALGLPERLGLPDRPRGPRRRLHNDNNKVIQQAFDREDQWDARWAVRLAYEHYTPEVLLTALATGTGSYATTAYYTKRILARIDSLIVEHGLQGELPPRLRDDNPDVMRLQKPGGGELLLTLDRKPLDIADDRAVLPVRGPDGKPVELEGQGHSVRKGVLYNASGVKVGKSLFF